MLFRPYFFVRLLTDDAELSNTRPQFIRRGGMSCSSILVAAAATAAEFLLHYAKQIEMFADEKIGGNSSVITRTRGHGVALHKAATISSRHPATLP